MFPDDINGDSEEADRYDPEFPFWAPGSYSVYTQPPTFDPPSCSFRFRSRLRPRKAPLSPCRKDPKLGNPVFPTHSIDTSPALASWSPDFAVLIATVCPVASGKTAILRTEEDEAGDPPAQAGYTYLGHQTWREHLMASFHREARC